MHREVAVKDAEIAKLKALAKSGGVSLQTLKPAIDAAERARFELLAQAE